MGRRRVTVFRVLLSVLANAHGPRRDLRLSRRQARRRFGRDGTGDDFGYAISHDEGGFINAVEEEGGVDGHFKTEWPCIVVFSGLPVGSVRDRGVAANR